ncbi:PREDICTED: uncharacterized protein LOC106117432 [Papilio xuthus]|uniref:Uncharacterized protein LOC106117432 n=1 Tax=Papilio xuthus TaxID=66420 RepID=A0A194PQP4_PAPXU|nr:PREDICTED: uncharacterized protein LOC106117432 [Papilio xuthus]KPI93450.1 hypothetical protein RR46_10710 [Papilio xuthus]
MRALAFFLLIMLPNYSVQGLCGESIRWSHRFNVDDVFGIWYGVGYAQHTPDMTDKPNEIGCVSLYITDATYQVRDDWVNWDVPPINYTDKNWRSDKSNPWSGDALAGSWLDIALRRQIKRSVNIQRRVRVMWDEDGQTMEQIYIYSPEDPGIWIAEKLRPFEREMRERGIDIWYADNPPRHPEVIRVLNATAHTLLINHCSEIGNGGIFTLILRRSISKLQRWDWFKYEQEFYKYDLPRMYRHAAVCAGCINYSSIAFMFVCLYMCYIQIYYR